MILPHERQTPPRRGSTTPSRSARRPTRSTEAAITFKSFIPAGNSGVVPAVYTSPHSIEFIGDDIAAGRGVLSAATTMAQCAIVNGVPGITNAASTEYDSYAALVSRSFGAERYKPLRVQRKASRTATGRCRAAAPDALHAGPAWRGRPARGPPTPQRRPRSPSSSSSTSAATATSPPRQTASPGRCRPPTRCSRRPSRGRTRPSSGWSGRRIRARSDPRRRGQRSAPGQHRPQHPADARDRDRHAHAGARRDRRDDGGLLRAPSP